MNTTEKSPATNAVSLHTEQPVSVSAAEEKDLTTNFYMVGGAINIFVGARRYARLALSLSGET